MYLRVLAARQARNGAAGWLRADYHNMSRYGVHFNHSLDMRIKRETQKRFEELYGHYAFMWAFGKKLSGG